MVDRPILFSAPMVRALLDGRKTQTRRLVAAHNCTINGSTFRSASPAWKGLDFERAEVRTKSAMTGLPDLQLATPFRHPNDPKSPDFEAIYNVRPIVEIGDRLWVRETWRTTAAFDDAKPQYVPSNALVSYDADYTQEPNDGCRGRTRVSIFMPRWASRLTLVVTDVRIERVNEISHIDCYAEGCPRPTNPALGNLLCEMNNARNAFAEIWKAVNGVDFWTDSRWVVALTFTAAKRNIDAVSP